MPSFETLFPLGITHYLIGGLFLGVAVSFLYLMTGLIGGMSTFFSSTWSYFSNWSYFHQQKFVESRNWRTFFAVGLILGAVIWLFSVGEPFVTTVPWWQLAVGGFVVGFGSRLSGGCTSGHGICGLASLQLPSLLAVLIFLATAMVTASLVKLVGGV